jgi:hypothetical protein
MSRGPQTFRQRDLKAAIRGVEAAGHTVARIEIGKDGKIVIIPAREGGAGSLDEVNEWDDNV